MSLPPKTHISTWNSIPWLKLMSFIDHRNLPRPRTAFMGSIKSGLRLLTVNLCFHRKKYRKTQIEKELISLK